MRPKHIVLEFARTHRADDPYAFDFGAEEYLVRSEGGGFRGAKLEWSDALLDDLDAVRMPGCDPAVVKRMGDRIRRFVKPVDFARHERTIKEAAADQEVHVTVRSAAAELYALPWELVTLSASGQHIGELPRVLLRYSWPETATTAAPEPRDEGGRVLMAWSAAGGAVPSGDHRDAIAHACAAAYHPFDPDADVLPRVSVAALDQALSTAAERGRPFSVLHILCHGVAQGQTFGLAWNADDQRTAIVDAGRLRQLLAPHADQLRLVVLCACDGGNLGELGNHLGSVAQNLHTAGIQSVVASRFPLSVRGSTRLTRTLYRSLLVELASLERAFLAARKAVAVDAGNLDWASLQLFARAEDGDDTRPVIVRPYRGLLPFQRHHARFFFGRDAETSEILSDLQNLIQDGKPRLLVVAGASGTGKSSVVMAGAIPELVGQSTPGPEGGDRDDDDSGVARDLRQVMRTLETWKGRTFNEQIDQGLHLLRRGLSEVADVHGGRWEVAVMRVGTDPVGALESALASRRHPELPFLLVIDQFEELFTSIDQSPTRQQFVRALWSRCKGDTGVSCIVTIRVDFLGACGEIVVDDAGLRLDQIAYDEAHRIFVAQMAVEQLRAAIEEPARRVGLELEPGLADTVLADVGGELGALPLLQYTLDLLWQRRKGRTLTAEAYHELGGVAGALQKRADALIDDLEPDAKHQARRLLVRLVGVDLRSALDTRRRASIEQLRPHDPDDRDAFDRVLDTLVGARLLVRGDQGGEPTVEVAHEALIRKWPRLRRWLDEDRDKLGELRDLEQWAEQWQTYGSPLEGDQLGYALQVRDKYPDDVGGLVAEMIDASVASRDAQEQEHEAREARERRNQRLKYRIAIGAAIGLLATAAVVGYMAFELEAQENAAQEEKHEAQRLREEAERQKKIAQQERAEAQELATKESAAREDAERAKKRAEDAIAAERVARTEAEARRQAEERAKASAQQAQRRAVVEQHAAQRAAASEHAANQVAQRARAEADRERRAALAAAERERALKEEEQNRNDRLLQSMGGGIITELPGRKAGQSPAKPPSGARKSLSPNSPPDVPPGREGPGPN